MISSCGADAMAMLVIGLSDAAGRACGERLSPTSLRPGDGRKRSPWAKCLGSAGRLRCGPAKLRYVARWLASIARTPRNSRASSGTNNLAGWDRAPSRHLVDLISSAAVQDLVRAAARRAV